MNEWVYLVPQFTIVKIKQNYPAVVAWFAKASISHSIDSDLSVNGGSNPACGY